MTPAPAARRTILVLDPDPDTAATVARVLALLGAAVPPARGGIDGARTIAALNDRLLAAFATDVDDWAPGEVGPPDAALRSAMQAALAEAAGAASLVVLDDPRLARLLPAWRPVLEAAGFALSCILPTRDPGAAVASRATRDGMTEEQAFLLWLRHLLDAERHTRDLPRLILSFDALRDGWRATLADAEALLGLRWPIPPEHAAGAIDALLDGLPRDAAPAPLRTPSAFADTWRRHAEAAFRRLSVAPHDAEAMAALDRLRLQFDAATALFAPAAPVAIRRDPGRADLRRVTLCAADTRTPALAARALRRTLERCAVADAILFADQPSDGPWRGVAIAPFAGPADYSRFVLHDLADHVATSHVLIVQWDGYVLDAACWDPAFLAVDYIGAPWIGGPWIGEPRPGSDAPVGNGGFSLRSRRLLDALRDPDLVRDPALAEDAQICGPWRRTLTERHGIRFAPPTLAARFAWERTRPAGPTFGFHGLFNMHRVMDDVELAGLAALLPPAVIRGREYAELAALCFDAGRRAVLPALGAAWRRHAGPDAIAASLSVPLPDERLRARCLAALEIAQPAPT